MLKCRALQWRAHGPAPCRHAHLQGCRASSARTRPPARCSSTPGPAHARTHARTHACTHARTHAVPTAHVHGGKSSWWAERWNAQCGWVGGAMGMPAACARVHFREWTHSRLLACTTNRWPLPGPTLSSSPLSPERLTLATKPSSRTTPVATLTSLHACMRACIPPAGSHGGRRSTEE